MVKNMQKWYEAEVEDSDVVISSRIRLARNLNKYCFCDKLTEDDAKKMVQEIMGVKDYLSSGVTESFHGYLPNEMAELDKSSMVEWHMISPSFAEKKQNTGLIVSEDESLSILINDEDHIRIQSINGGLNMDRAFRRADALDDVLSEKFDFAFDEKFGYLTTSPTNVGTGLRASYMLFLPALTMAGKIQKLADEIGKYGIQIRGIYGDGTKSFGNIYTISNQKTLGCQESEILENLTQIVKQAISQERKRREYLITVNSEELEDKVYRSYGILKYAKKVNTVDAMTLLAQLKFGVDTNLIKLRQDTNLFQMIMEIQPASLQKISGKSMGSTERDHYRAEYINHKLPELL